MKRISILLMTLVMVLGLYVQARATLIVRGTDTLGYQLIYDDDLDITWYDFTNAFNTWQNQVDWAANLVVNFDGNIYDDWRLPIADEICSGYNCIGNEMGHLYYTELGNSMGLSTSFIDGATGGTGGDPPCFLRCCPQIPSPRGTRCGRRPMQRVDGEG